MTAAAYYNEPDAYAAQYLRNLIAAKQIPAGIVDERSIEEVQPDELREFTQCHFFAGIGGWAAALRAAGWPDDLPVWTGSCPCQPFSKIGARQGFDDDRHLWPQWARLIAKRRPRVVLGEQVAGALEWVDLVSADLEAEDYAFAAFDLCAAGFAMAPWSATGQAERLRGAILDGMDPQLAANIRDFAAFADAELGGFDAAHIRQRIYFVGMDNRERPRLERHAGDGDRGGQSGRVKAIADGPAAASGHAGGLAGWRAGGAGQGQAGWADIDWILCRDGSWRPVRSGTLPLANEAPARVGRLRAYGNAIDIGTATSFIQSVIEHIEERTE